MNNAPHVPIGVKVTTSASVADAAELLRSVVEAQVSIDEGTAPGPPRRLAGTVIDDRVDLSVRPPGKGYQTVSRGSLREMSGGAVLRGTIDIADHRQLRAFLKLFTAAGLLIVPLAIGLQLGALGNGSAFEWVPVVLAAGVAVVTVFATRRVESDIERVAAEDARLVAAFLERTFAERLPQTGAASRDIPQR